MIAMAFFGVTGLGYQDPIKSSVIDKSADRLSTGISNFFFVNFELSSADLPPLSRSDTLTQRGTCNLPAFFVPYAQYWIPVVCFGCPVPCPYYGFSAFADVFLSIILLLRCCRYCLIWYCT